MDKRNNLAKHQHGPYSEALLYVVVKSQKTYKKFIITPSLPDLAYRKSSLLMSKYVVCE